MDLGCNFEIEFFKKLQNEAGKSFIHYIAAFKKTTSNSTYASQI